MLAKQSKLIQRGFYDTWKNEAVYELRLQSQRWYTTGVSRRENRVSFLRIATRIHQPSAWSREGLRKRRRKNSGPQGDRARVEHPETAQEETA